MAYKYSSGDRKFNDIIAENDEQSNTKIDFEEDYIALETGGNAVLAVSGSKVGINTTTPDYTFHVASAASAVALIDGAGGSDSILRFGQGGVLKSHIKQGAGGNLVITNETSDKDIILNIKDNTTEREGLRLNGDVAEVVINEGSDSLVDFRVESTNNTHMVFVDGGTNRVGINESSPQSTMHINGTLLVSSSLGTELLRLQKAEGDTREIVFENEGVDIASIFVNAAESLRLKCEKNNGNMVFQVKNSNVVTNMFTLDGATLQAGVNTASPTAPFDVAGDTIRLRDSRTPSSASDLGQPGEICWDSDYLYICVAIDTWKRIALSAW